MILTAVAIGAMTVGFVLFVLPQRFVLQGDLRASGVTFPTGLPLFQPSDVAMRPPRMPATSIAPETKGPAELLWAAVLPLLAEEDHAGALPLLAAYLAEYPGDHSVRLEHAIVLVRARRPGEGESEFRRVLAGSESVRARLELARLLHARGEVEEAIELVAGIPSGTPQAAEVAALSRELAAALPLPERTEERADAAFVTEATASAIEPAAATEPDTSYDPLADARKAVSDGDLESARIFYLAALEEHPEDGPLLIEWSEVLQFHLEELDGALDALVNAARIVSLTTSERFRLAQLLIWTGSEEAAEPELRAVVALDPSHGGAWGLLGDVLRWQARRRESADAYRHALDVDPTEPVAIAGRALLTEDTERAVALIDGRRANPVLSFVADSDGFRRVEARAYASMLPFPEVVELLLGFRRLEGFDLAGLAASDNGAFAEGTIARWWGEGSFRASATIGAERSALRGAEGVFGLGFQARDLRGWNLEASFRSAPGHTLTSTFESLAAGTRAERLGLDYYHGLPAGLEMSGTIEGVRLRGGSAASLRLASGIAVTRVLGDWLRAGVSSRYLTYSKAAPIPANRRLFWDPELYWSTGVLFELRTPTPTPTSRLSAYVRATPGIALARERDTVGEVWVRQLESEAGFRIRSGSFAIAVDGFFARGRAGEYTSHGVSIGVEVLR